MPSKSQYQTVTTVSHLQTTYISDIIFSVVYWQKNVHITCKKWQNISSATTSDFFPISSTSLAILQFSFKFQTTQQSRDTNTFHFCHAKYDQRCLLTYDNTWKNAFLSYTWVLNKRQLINNDMKIKTYFNEDNVDRIE